MAKEAAGTTEAKAEKRLTIAPTFDQETFDEIVQRAKDDERSPAQWLARFVRGQLNGSSTVSRTSATE